MNKYIETDISDGIKQMIIGFSNLIHEITSHNEESYVLYDSGLSLYFIENFLWQYIPYVSESQWKDGVLHITIDDTPISVDKLDEEDCIIFKREEK